MKLFNRASIISLFVLGFLKIETISAEEFVDDPNLALETRRLREELEKQREAAEEQREQADKNYKSAKFEAHI